MSDKHQERGKHVTPPPALDDYRQPASQPAHMRRGMVGSPFTGVPEPSILTTQRIAKSKQQGKPTPKDGLVAAPGKVHPKTPDPCKR